MGAHDRLDALVEEEGRGRPVQELHHPRQVLHGSYLGEGQGGNVTGSGTGSGGTNWNAVKRVVDHASCRRARARARGALNVGPDREVKQRGSPFKVAQDEVRNAKVVGKGRGVGGVGT